MDIYEILIATYGLAISPISGIYFFKLRLKTGLKKAKDFWGYLLFGIINVSITIYTVTLLPEESLLTYWGGVIIILYIFGYGQSPYIQRFRL